VRKICLVVTILSITGILMSRTPSKRLDDRVVIATSTSLDITVRLPRNEKGLCPDKVRAGDANDGGWWICHGNKRPNCVVYSFGIRDNFSFDHAMVTQHGCIVHGFDPSPDGLASKPAYETQGTAAVYHSMGLGTTDGTFGPGLVPFRWPGIGYLRDSNTKSWVLKRIPTIMKELGNKKLSILKVDAEGAEWDMIPDLLGADWDEACMELHFPPNEYSLKKAPSNDDMIIIQRISDPSPLEYPEQNVAPINHIAILKGLLAKADVFHWDRNGAHCLEVYFLRKQ